MFNIVSLFISNYNSQLLDKTKPSFQGHDSGHILG